VILNKTCQTYIGTMLPRGRIWQMIYRNAKILKYNLVDSMGPNYIRQPY